MDNFGRENQANKMENPYGINYFETSAPEVFEAATGNLYHFKTFIGEHEINVEFADCVYFFDDDLQTAFVRRDKCVIKSKHCASVAEYKTFFADIIESKISFTKFSPPLCDYLNPNKIIVTGEHGDQIFGSDKAKFHVITKQAFRPYKEILPFVIARKLGSNKDVEQIMEYLAPQVEKSPVKIETLYDYL